ncbi:heterokaryon incompatibility protein-domain-containing protein [Podospora didyma]|uniref:Heterokaryon incompatibility protein-domain-containing protein n=1 Tax=Podospora didyma TaxID=330526 RepID=A0AAE0K0V6_9PEZI|nr:heterokaryon incompatibility protein-domain-containing protein [Podospora didyma]
MWLIDTATMRMHDVFNTEDHKYAILSHTWEDDEVNFEDMTLRPYVARQKKGYLKIEKTCQLAKERGIPYAWVDTCCIDKTSSAALSEAINSMFLWYKESNVCFAYLSDLPSDTPELPRLAVKMGFSHCRWFTRGWTLQELIAPELLEFYDADWNFLGTKSILRVEVSISTGIDVDVLEDVGKLSTVPVGRRMAWAANRTTTRIEDMAYCLLGIFDVNMPMIYGEGPKAFFRLQEEIIKNTNDLSLFAWNSQPGAGTDLRPTFWEYHQEQFRGILASSPAEFRNCLKLEHDPDSRRDNREFVMTNNGLRIDCSLAVHQPDRDYIFSLGCRSPFKGLGMRALGIRLAKADGGFVRVAATETFALPKDIDTEGEALVFGPVSTVYIRKGVRAAIAKKIRERSRIRRIYSLHLPPGWEKRTVSSTPKSRLDPDAMVCYTRTLRSFLDILHFSFVPESPGLTKGTAVVNLNFLFSSKFLVVDDFRFAVLDDDDMAELKPIVDIDEDLGFRKANEIISRSWKSRDSESPTIRPKEWRIYEDFAYRIDVSHSPNLKAISRDDRNEDFSLKVDIYVKPRPTDSSSYEFFTTWNKEIESTKVAL